MTTFLIWATGACIFGTFVTCTQPIKRDEDMLGAIIISVFWFIIAPIAIGLEIGLRMRMRK